MTKMKKEDIVMVLLLLAAALCCSCSGNDKHLHHEDIVMNISDADVKGMETKTVHGHAHYFLIVRDYARGGAHVRAVPVSATTWHEVKYMSKHSYSWAASLGKCPSDTLVYSFVTTPKEYNLEKGIWQDIYSHK